jgi:hypothetical protein
MDDNKAHQFVPALLIPGVLRRQHLVSHKVASTGSLLTWRTLHSVVYDVEYWKASCRCIAELRDFDIRPHKMGGSGSPPAFLQVQFTYSQAEKLMLTVFIF